ncbi:MAG: multiprotein bridging factor aMBF1 [Halobacteriota archaeon]|nr:multiprotein bridging factor aMBF1 [Halobacteriota archaeon]
MQCEICGAEIFGRPNRIETEGSELNVCNSCVRYGTVVDKPHVPRKIVRLSRSRQSKIETEEMVHNYGQMIREAREERAWSREEFAKKLNEKASLISKIERNEIVPDDEVRRKIEKMMKIKLTERVELMDVGSSKSSKDLTLGDIASIKKR